MKRILTLSIATFAATSLMLTGCGKKSADGGGKKDGVSIQNIGSDTMVNLAQAWAEKYHDVDPKVSVEVAGGGSGIGVAALINGTCDSISGGSSSVFERVALAMSSTAVAPRGEPSSAYLFLGGSLTGLAGRGASFLGRPWGQLSTAVFRDVVLSADVAPPGWQTMGHDCTNTAWCAPLLFAEANSSGAGADPAGRVPWSRQLNASEAALWTRDRVLRGWQPEEALRGDI